MGSAKLALNWKHFPHGKRTKSSSKESLKLSHFHDIVELSSLIIVIAKTSLQFGDYSIAYDQLWFVSHTRLQPLLVQLIFHLTPYLINYYIYAYGSTTKIGD